MADKFDTPSNIEFTQQNIDTTLGQEFGSPPSDLDYDIMFSKFNDAANSIMYASDYNKVDGYGNTGPFSNPYKDSVQLSDSEVSILKGLKNYTKDINKGPEPLTPLYTNKRLTNYERYYNHPKFGELGWHPYRDNETIYNENSTVWDDYGRMIKQFPKLLYTGFVSSFRSLGDLFDDDSYFLGKDLDSAREFSEAMRIGNSTRGGVGELTNNLFLQFGYTGGIILNIAAEEFILSALTGGGSIFTAPGRALAKTGSSLARMTRVREGADLLRSAVGQMRNVDNSKTFFQAVKSGDSKLMSFILPETMQARRLVTSAKGMEQLSDFGRTFKSFGGFYRDLRSFNYALSEGKMEAGMVYDQRIANGLESRAKQSENGYISDEDIELITSKANESALYTTALNTPFIYFTNQFLLGNAFSSSNRSLSRLLADNTDRVASRLIRRTPGKKGVKEGAENIVRASDSGLKGAWQRNFGNGFIKGTGAMALRYTNANFGEGIQEVYQEAVAEGVGEFYDALIKDPTLDQRNLFASSLSHGLSSQISEQGFETFLTGFLMGTLAGPTQSFIFQGLPTAKNYVFNRQKFLDDKAELEKEVIKLQDQINSEYTKFKQDPDAYLDLSIKNTIIQRQVSQSLQEAHANEDNYEAINQVDFSKFTQIYTAASNGTLDIFREQLYDYLKLSDEDILTAFPSFKSEIKTGKVKERLNSYIEQIDSIEELYNKRKNTYLNPFKPSKFDPLKDPLLYMEESLKYNAFEDVRYIAMFAENQMIRAGERMISIYESLMQNPVFKNMSANDLVVLLSDENLADELNVLKSELDVAKESNIKNKLIESKEKKYYNLLAIQDYLKEARDATGSIKDENKAKLKRMFVNYVNQLSEDKNDILDNTLLDDQVAKIFDYNKLSRDEKIFNRAVLSYSDPAKFDYIFTQVYNKKKDINNKLPQLFKQSINRSINNQVFKKILNDAADQGYFLNQEEVVEFAKGGYSDISIITELYDENGLVDNKEFLDNLKQLIVDAVLTEQEEQEEQTNKQILAPELETLIDEYELESYEALDQEQDKEINELENAILEKIAILNNLISVNEINKKYQEKVTSIVDGLLVAAYNSEDINTFDILELYKQYLDQSIDENIKTFLDRLFSYYDDEGIVKESLENVILEPQEEDEEIEETDDEEEEENKLIIKSRRFDDLDGLEISIRKIKNKDKYIFTVNGEKLNQNLKLYFGLKESTSSVFDTEEAASEKLQSLEAIEGVENSSYEINNKIFSPNLIVYDKNNKEYTIVNTLRDIIIDPGKITIVDNLSNTESNFLPKRFLDLFKKEKYKKNYSNKIKSIYNNVEFIRNKKPRSSKDPDYKEYPQDAYNIAMAFFSQVDTEGLFEIVVKIGDAKQDQPYQPDPNQDPHSNIFYKSTPYSISIRLTDAGVQNLGDVFNEYNIDIPETRILGYINSGNLRFKDDSGNEIEPVKMTLAQAQMFYNDVNQNNYQDLINNFAAEAIMVNALDNKIVTEENYTFSIAEFNKLTGISFVNTNQAFEYTSELSDVSLIPFSFNADPEKQKVFIYRNEFDLQVADVVSNRVSGNPKLEDNLSLQIENFNDSKKLEQGYMAYSVLPNGQIFYIPLKTRRLTEDEVVEAFNKLKEGSKKAKDKEQGFNLLDFNTNKGYFLAMPKGYFLDVNVSKGGAIEFKLSQRQYKNGKYVPDFEQTLRFSYDDFQSASFSTLKNVLDYFNTALEKNIDKSKSPDFKLSIDSFRLNLDKNATYDQVIEAVETNLSSKIFKINNFNISVDSAQTQQFINNLDNKVEEEEQDDSEVDESVKTELEELNQTKKELEKKLIQLSIQLRKAKKKGQDIKTIENDIEDLKQKLGLVEEEINQKTIIDKIVNKSHTKLSVEDINVFTDWLKQNLPDFITVDNIDQLKDNLLRGGERVGGFMMDLRRIAGRMEVNGIIYTNEQNPYKYHEAFHAVFRLLLSDEQIEAYYKLALKEVREKLRSEGKDLKQELEIFRNLKKEFDSFSDKKLLERYLEEYMADKFDEFKVDRKSTKTDSFIKSLFNRIMEFINLVLSGFRKSNVYSNLNQLFYDIDSGKYKSAALMDNRFTNPESEQYGQIVDALVPWQEINGKYKYLDSDTGDALITHIYARVIDRQEDPLNKLSVNELINESIDLYTELYNLNFEDESVEDIEKLSTVLDALENFKPIIVNQVKERLKNINLTDEAINESAEAELNEVGENTNNFNLKAELIGVEKSLPNFVRKYISSTTVVSKDIFGNEDLRLGEKIVTTVNQYSVYNGILRATQGVFNETDMLVRLVMFTENSNYETRAVVDRMLIDSGITRDIVNKRIATGETELIISEDIKKGSYHLHKVLKAFENSKFTYKTSVYNKLTNKSYTYDPMQYSAYQAQLENWNASHNKSQERDLVQRVKSLNDAYSKFDSINRLGSNGITDNEINKLSIEISKDIEFGSGINLNPLYIKYSMLRMLPESTTKKQESLVDQFKNESVVAIQLNEIEKIKNNVKNSVYIFSKDSGGSTLKTIRRFAFSNIFFDESVGQTTFLNPERERVYAHQLPTFNAKFVESITDDFEGFVQSLKNNDEILEFNHLLRDYTDKNGNLIPGFKDFVEKGLFQYERIAGFEEKSKNLDSISGAVSNKGKSYGKLTQLEFLKVLLINYTANVDWNGTFKGDSNDIQTLLVGSSPIFSRVAETSRTGPQFQMPIYKAIDENGNLSEKALLDFYLYVKGEFERIRRESAPNTNTELINNFNARVDSSTGELVRDLEKQGTAFKLFKTSFILNNNLQEVFEENNPQTNELLYDAISKSRSGEVTIKEGTKILDILEKDKSVTIKVIVKQNEDQFETDFIPAYFTYSGTTKNGLKFKYDRDYNEFVDRSVTDKLESYALSLDNRDQTFEDIIKQEFGEDVIEINGFPVPAVFEQKLEKEFDKFTRMLEDLGVDIYDKKGEYFNILKGDLLDLDYIEKNTSPGSLKYYESFADTTRETLNIKKYENNLSINHNLKQIWFNYFYNNFALNQLLLGDHAKIFKNYQSQIKRGKGPEAAGKSARTDFSDESLGVYKSVKEFDLIVFNEPKNKSSLTGNNIDEADGQLYMTVDAFRYFWFGIGELSKFQAKMLDKIKNGEKLTVEELWGDGKIDGLVARGEMLNPKKLSYNDAVNMVKMSANVLRKEDTSEKVGNKWVAKPNKIILHNLREKMEQHELLNGVPTVSAPLSAVKKMQKNINTLGSIIKDDTIAEELGVMKLDAMYFIKQQVNPSNKLKITDPTQIVYLLHNEQDDNVEVYLNGEYIPIKKIKESFEKNKSEILKLNYRNKKSLVFDTALQEFSAFKDTGVMTPNLLSFLRYAQESIKSSNSSSDLLQFFDLSNESFNSGLLNNPRSIKKYSELILSYFSKSVLKQTIPGTQLTMKSDFGDRIYRRVYSYRKVQFVENGKTVTYYLPDKQEVIREAVALKDRTIRNGFKLHIDMDPTSVSNGKNIISDQAGSDKNLMGLKALVDADVNNEGVIIVDRLRYDMTEYTYTNKNDISTWVSTNQKYTEAITAILDPEVYKKLSIIKEGINELNNQFKQWVSLKNFPVKGGLFISRKDKTNYNEQKEKLNFARSKGIWYDKKTDMFVPKGFEQIPEVLAKIFALRIPTQDKHSSLGIKAVDFMSATNGSTVSLAREIVEVSGADFDIDKLFAHFKEYVYDKDLRNFVEIGSREGEEYTDYVKYVNKKVLEPGTIYFEANDKYEADEVFPNGVTITKAEKNKLKLYMNNKAFNALKMLGLPVTYEEFYKYYEDNGSYPFDAINQNKVLDSKFALITNSSITSKSKLYLNSDGRVTRVQEGQELQQELPAVAYQANSLKSLEDILEKFKSYFPAWATTVIDDIFDVDTITGAVLGYQNNQVGARLIGASVLPNTYLPKLATLGISINENFQLNINGVNFNKYGTILENKGNNEFGNRIQDNMSTIINSMVDNATEQYAGKFRININSLGVLSNMLSLGVPLETGLMFLINPEVLNLYNIHDTGSQFKRGMSFLINDIEKKLDSINIDPSKNITNDDLKYLVNSNYKIDELLNKKSLNQSEINFLSLNYAMFNNYRNANNLADYNFSLGTLFSLSKGNQDISSIDNLDEAIKNLNLEQDKSDPKKHPYDAKLIFVDNPLSQIVKTYYDIYKDIRKNVLPSLVFTETKPFIDLYNSILDVLGYVKKDGKEKLKYDLASYIQIKEYINYLRSNPKGTDIYLLDSLDNSIIYPIKSDGSINKNTITNIVDRAIENNPNLVDNFFIYSYVGLVNANAESGSELDVLSYNLMTKLPDYQKRDIIDDFIKLYKDSSTKSLAIQIFNYLLVKDGFQYKRDSIIQAISPIVMEDFIDVSSNVFEKFKRYEFEDVSLPLNGYFREFVENYFKSQSIFGNPNFGFNKRKNVKVLESVDTYEYEYRRGENLEFIDATRNNTYVFNPFGLNRIDNNVVVENLSFDKGVVDFAKDTLIDFKNFSKGFNFSFDNKTKQFLFPPFIQIETTDENGEVIGSDTYQLSNLASKSSNDQVIGIQQTEYAGYYAEYIKVESMGSKQQWGAGFLFGNRPPNSLLTDYIKNSTANDVSIEFEIPQYDVMPEDIEEDEFNELKADLEDKIRQNLTTLVSSTDMAEYLNIINTRVKSLKDKQGKPIRFESLDDLTNFMIALNKNSPTEENKKELLDCFNIGFLS